MNKEKKIDFLLNENLKIVLLKMGIPTMLGMIITALYNVINSYFVSQLGGSQFAAVGIVFPILQIMIGVGMTFGSGAGVYISRLLGEKNNEKANRVASVAVLYGFIITIIFISILLLFLPQLLVLIGATPTILVYAKGYAQIIILASIFTVFNVMMNNLVTAEGQANKTMLIMGASAILNIILAPILIFKFKMGINGAGYATAISQIFSTLIYISLIFRNRLIIKINFKNSKINKEIISQILKVGVPILMYQLLTSIAMSLTNIAAKPYGDDVIAAMNIMILSTLFGIYFVFGFTKGFMPVVAINYGAKRMDRVKEAIKLTNKWGLIFCIIFGLSLAAGSGLIANAFSNNGSELLLGVAKKALIYNGIIFILFAYQNVYSSAFLAMGKGREGGLLSISRQGLFFIPFILVLPQFWGIIGVLLAQPLADAFTIILTKYFVVKNRRLLLG